MPIMEKKTISRVVTFRPKKHENRLLMLYRLYTVDMCFSLRVFFERCNVRGRLFSVFQTKQMRIFVEQNQTP